jgi:hypothetical protein
MEGLAMVMERQGVKQQPTPWEGELRTQGDVSQAVEIRTLVGRDPDCEEEGE